MARSKLNRRQFIASAGAATAYLAAGAPSLARAVDNQGQESQTQNPPSAKPSPLRSRVSHESGIPLGGIGAGSVEIRPDGYFHDWLIFNLGSWAPDQPKAEQGAEPDMGPGALAFFVRSQTKNGEPVLRRLGLREDQNDLYSLGWAKNVQEIDYRGAFPVAELHYLDESLPVDISAEFFSPFIPHDAQTSGTPGFHGVFKITNSGQEPVDISLMCRLKNPVAFGNPDRMLKSVLETNSHGAAITMRTTCDGPRQSTIGSLSFSMSGGAPSWILADFESYLSNGGWIGGPHYGTVEETYLRSYRTSGALPSLSGSECPCGKLKLSDDEIGNLSDDDQISLIRKLAQFPSIASLFDRIKEVEPSEFESKEGRTRILTETKLRLDHLAGKERTDASWGTGALANRIQLQPGESKEINFELAWHFPHHFSADGPEMGHMYEHWFADAREANRFLATNREKHGKEVRAFLENLQDTSLPAELAAAWSEQLSTLAKCTWWTRADRFGVWEGLGCCGFRTMDITYQGSFSILALFPELQKSQMRMGTDYQRADGRVAHFFTPDLLHVDNGFDRVDMNPQFVMIVCRDYLWTGDKDYLARVFPAVTRAIASIARLDSNGDGLPDQETKRNTYDNWNFFGTPSYISSLWLGSLAAAERMARDLGKSDLAGQWKEMRLKGAESFDRMLWNDEYYSLWVDGENRDECCMSDQLSGVWFSHLMGLDDVVAPDRVRAAAKAIIEHNFSHEVGLTNATYPPGRKPKFSTYMNGQATATWTGVEYAFASMLYDFGMPSEADAIVRAISDRYRRTGRVWNHVECGDHYYRAMCSWSTLLGATGFRVDAPNGIVSVLPAIQGDAENPFRAPWVSSSGWGLVSVTSNQVFVRCLSGKLEISELRVPLSTKVRRADKDGADLAVKVEEAAGCLRVRFDAPISISQGAVLNVS